MTFLLHYSENFGIFVYKIKDIPYTNTIHVFNIVIKRNAFERIDFVKQFLN